MTDRLRIELESDLDRIIAQARNADTKLNIALPLAASMLGTLAAIAAKVEEWATVSAITASIAGAILVGTLITSFLAAIPRTKAKGTSLVHFDSITDMCVEDYVDQRTLQDEKKRIDDIARQCHSVAHIAATKYNLAKIGILLLLAAAPFWVASIFFALRGQ